MNRYDPIEATDCMIRIRRGDVWYQMRPLIASVAHSRRVIERLRRRGRTVHVTWVSGMGLNLNG